MSGQFDTITTSAGEDIESEDQYSVGGEYTDDEDEDEGEVEEEEEEEENPDNMQDSACSHLSSTELDAVAKIETVLRALITVKWSLPVFLKALVQEHDRYGNDIIVDIHKWRTCAQRRATVTRTISQAELFELNMGELRVPTLLDEFKLLRKQSYFGKFDETANIETFDFAAAEKIVESTAPSGTTPLHDYFKISDMVSQVMRKQRLQKGQKNYSGRRRFLIKCSW